jgi:GLPGLI family protein
MKKMTSMVVFLLLSFLFSSSALFAGDKGFEGIITYKITYPDNKFNEGQQAMLPKMFTISVKGTKARTEMNSSMGNQVEITDYADQTQVVLFDMMGQKFSMKSTKEDIQKENAKAPVPTVEITNETKMIAGYKCKKAVVTTNDDGVKSTFEVYYTSDLGPKAVNFYNPLYKDIDGVMLEFTMKEQQFTMVFTATAIEKKGLSAKDFDVPAEFKPITKEELQKKFGGGQ